jgi:hypothetical protein
MADYEDEEGNFLESRLETERPRGLSEKTKKTYAIEVSRPVRRFYTSGKFSFAPVPAGVLKMVINSPQLLSALREVAHYHPPGLLERDQLTIQEPFDFVVQQMARLEEHVANSAENNTLKAHFELLKRFLNEKYGEDLAAEEALRSQKPPRCSFKMLWLLFERGEDVVYRSDKDFRAFVVSETTDPRRQEKKQSKHNGFVIDCWYMDFDGKEFGRVQKSEESSFTIFPFQGSKEITSLPIYPMTYHTDKKGEPTLREHLIERGQKFWKLRSATQKEYKGETLDYGKRYIDSRVMVDYQTYVRLFFDEIMLGQLQIEDEILTSKPIDGCNCFACLQSKEDGAQGRTAVFEKYDHIPVEAESLTEHQLMLLTNRVPGFYLQDRKWGKLFSPPLDTSLLIFDF